MAKSREKMGKKNHNNNKRAIESHQLSNNINEWNRQQITVYDDDILFCGMMMTTMRWPKAILPIGIATVDMTEGSILHQ